MAMKWVELVTGSLEQQKHHRPYVARVDALPEPYGGVADRLAVAVEHAEPEVRS